MAGVMLDILLHVLQLLKVKALDALQGYTAEITILSNVLFAASLIVQFNLGALLLCIFLAGLAMYSKITGKEIDH